MGRDRHEPPPGLSEEERKRWQQWRRFTWLEGDIVILKRGDGKKPRKDADGGRDDGKPGDAGAR